MPRRRAKNPLKRKHNKFPGYPRYPASEDIYSREKEEVDLDPENPSVKKAPNADPDHRNEKDFVEDVSGEDLDIPGVDTEETAKESIAEDEENNHYSLGGDNHHNLEEGLWE
jgi:hypothetical protein